MPPELFQDFMVFFPDVTQGNEHAGPVQGYLLLLFFWCKSGELGYMGSSRLLCVTSVVESFSTDLLQTMISCFVERI